MRGAAAPAGAARETTAEGGGKKRKEEEIEMEFVRRAPPPQPALTVGRGDYVKQHQHIECFCWNGRNI